MTVWRVAIDENGENTSYSELKARGVIAIGWCGLGSFAGLIGQPHSVIEQHAQTTGDSVYAPTPSELGHWWFGTPPGHTPSYGGHRMHIGRIFDYLLIKFLPVIWYWGMLVYLLLELQKFVIIRDIFTIRLMSMLIVGDQ